jgi:hypothetical protein
MLINNNDTKCNINPIITDNKLKFISELAYVSLGNIWPDKNNKKEVLIMNKRLNPIISVLFLYEK